MLFVAPLSAVVMGSASSGFFTLVAGYTLVPVGVLINRARRLLNAGFGHSDIGVAFKAEIDRGREERSFGLGHGGGASAFERILRWISGVGLGVAVFALAGYAASDPPNIPLAITLMWSMTAGMASGIGALVMLQRRRDVDAEFWGRLWTGRLGRWLFSVAHMFTGTKALPASLTHRPTELALGMAAEQLYDTLPKETRRQLRDLPDVVHRLEEDAQRMRARLEELQEALADVGHSGNPDPAIGARHERIVADLSAERDLVQQRLKDAVAALETIRLNLLRLHAGTGSVQRLTTDLGLAREVAQSISRQIEGFREAESAL